MERRSERRDLRFITVRYKQKGDIAFTVSEAVDFTEKGFCLMMPLDLDVDREFEFEAFDGGSSVKGHARVVWVDRGRIKAGCSYLHE